MSIHHMKYLELDGADEFTFMSKGEHNEITQTRDPTNGRFIKKVGERIPDRVSQMAFHRLMNKNRFVFNTKLAKNIHLKEDIIINPDSNEILVSSYFQINRGNYDWVF